MAFGLTVKAVYAKDIKLSVDNIVGKTVRGCLCDGETAADIGQGDIEGSYPESDVTGDTYFQYHFGCHHIVTLMSRPRLKL